MKIVACIKQVPGTSKVEVDPETGVLKRDGIDSKINPYDLYALETALQLKESIGGELAAITMGPPQSEAILREAFMMGADEGTLLSDRRFAGSDVLATAYTLSQGIRKMGGFDLIICGKQTTDGDTAQVGPEVAEFLDIPHVANVRRIVEVKSKSVVVEMDLPHSVEVAEVAFPCLITVEKDIHTPRLPSFRLKLATRDRQVRTLTLDDLDDQDQARYGLDGSPTRVCRIFPPEANTDYDRWEGDSQTLAARLHDKLVELKFV